MATRPAPADRLNELIGAELRRHIVEGRLVAGVVLTETALARAFGVSRVPCAAALKRLSDEGFIRRHAGRGYMVAAAGTDAQPVHLDLSRAGLRVPEGLARSLSQRNLRGRLYSDIERDIAAHLMLGAFQVNETELAQYYDVSRTVAHEVLLRLERAGIIEQRRNGRWYLLQLDATRIREHYEIRRLLEPAALEAVAPALDAAELRLKRDRLIRARAEAAKVPPRAIERIEEDLHVEIVLACPNRQMREVIYRSQFATLGINLTFERYRDSGAYPATVEEHLRVIEHLAAGDAAGAARALAGHLEKALERSIVRLGRLGSLPRNRLPPYLLSGDR
jgi:DNA-binding GntR family transcriptional regulator